VKFNIYFYIPSYERTVESRRAELSSVQGLFNSVIISLLSA